ncbi:hypothetical protein M513_04436 [Trichuris suis]|uniref:Uncharacterized protein n=1 Tax=Trichuris suis TaxID=68888 RepID=A0A085MBZ0_9BILA|nr:hypothetical protein M513_04436 [Trichuris suis]
MSCLSQFTFNGTAHQSSVMCCMISEAIRRTGQSRELKISYENTKARLQDTLSSEALVAVIKGHWDAAGAVPLTVEHSVFLEQQQRGTSLHGCEQRILDCGAGRLARHCNACAVLALPSYSETSLTTKRPQVLKIRVDSLNAVLGVFCSAE